MNYKEYLSVAVACSEHISEIFKQGFFQQNTIEWKSEKDPVTEFDRNIESMSRKFILSHYPDHIILGEEDGLHKNQESDFKWIIDPIDGTINYTRGIPFVAFSLGLSYKDEMIVSVVSNPILNEVFTAIKGKGAWLNNTAITVSPEKNCKQSYLTLGTYREDYATIYHQFMHEFQSVRNPGSAALAMAYVAAGRMEGAVYFSLSPWDMAGGMLLITEAGGKITNINSQEFSLEKKTMIACSEFIYPYVAKILM